MQITIRPILQKDTIKMAALIRNVFEDMGVFKVETAYEDAALNDLHAFYQKPKATYLVAELEKTLVGGAGVSKLEDCFENVCELQKMYISANFRGMGIGSLLISKSLQEAKHFNYSGCYLETMPNMKAAQALYRKHSFEYIDAPMGNTGHNACQVYMFKKLD